MRFCLLIHGCSVIWVLLLLFSISILPLFELRLLMLDRFFGGEICKFLPRPWIYSILIGWRSLRSVLFLFGDIEGDCKARKHHDSVMFIRSWVECRLPLLIYCGQIEITQTDFDWGLCIENGVVLCGEIFEVRALR